MNPVNPDDVVNQAIATRQLKAQTYLAGMTSTGLALCIDKTDLHYAWDTAGRMYVDLTSGGGALPMGAYHQVNAAIWANPATSFPHFGPYGESCLQAQVDYGAAISEKFPHAHGKPQQVRFTDSGSTALLLAERLAAALSMFRTNVKPVDAYTYAPLDTGQAQKLCRLAVERDGPILLDERLTGYGRFGGFRAGQRYDLDEFADHTITVLGEAAGGGIPLGAVVAPRAYWERFQEPPGSGGNPVACGAGLRVLQLQDEMFYHHVRDLSRVFEDACEALRSQFPRLVLNHTGRGMLRSLRISTHVDEGLLTETLLNAGVIADVRWGHLRLAPPLIMTDLAVSSAFDQIADALVEVEKVVPAPA